MERGACSGASSATAGTSPRPTTSRCGRRSSRPRTRRLLARAALRAGRARARRRLRHGPGRVRGRRARSAPAGQVRRRRPVRRDGRRGARARARAPVRPRRASRGWTPSSSTLPDAQLRRRALRARPHVHARSRRRRCARCAACCGPAAAWCSRSGASARAAAGRRCSRSSTPKSRATCARCSSASARATRSRSFAPTPASTSVEQHRIATTLAYADGDEACDAAFVGGPVALAWSRFDDHAAPASVPATSPRSSRGAAAGGYRHPRRVRASPSRRTAPSGRA